jgi:hypothetical protein
MTAPPGRTVVSAQLLTGEKVAFTQNSKILTLAPPKVVPVTIVELTFDKSVDDLPAISGGEVSAFDDPVTYGHIVSRQATVKASSVNAGSLQALLAETPAADFAFHTAEEANPWIEIDLGREVPVTGVRVLNRTSCGQPGIDRAATLRLSVSTDGKIWSEVWKADRGLPAWEIPVTDILAGAQVPGRKARYLRFEIKPAKPEYLHLRQVEVWGKH